MAIIHYRIIKGHDQETPYDKFALDLCNVFPFADIISIIFIDD